MESGNLYVLVDVDITAAAEDLFFGLGRSLESGAGSGFRISCMFRDRKMNEQEIKYRKEHGRTC